MNSSRLRGFTLVELLVVIGIIALLISVLLPALQSARRQAEMVKCAAALREIGNANMMYVNENRGWAPPAKLTSYYRISYTNWNKGSSTIKPDDFGPQYWYNFLAKYVTRAKLGSASSAGSTSQQDSAAARASLFWGCPAWEGYYDTNAAYTGTGGINYSQTGYGYNGFPEYTASYPPATAQGQVLGDDGQAAAYGYVCPDPNATSAGITCVNGTSLTIGKQNWNQLTFGRWYKMHQYEIHGSERALVADTIFWLLEALPAPFPPTSIPGQNAQYNQVGNNTLTFNAKGQMLYDVYRHGKKSAIVGTGNTQVYRIPGGKVAYNVLFCDGHVATLIDYESGYRAARMRYPG
jgi:prepilin-type N-terminal cleavage/methylation domain-containing protein/prepilin-type processing-associated H-X9-DG protein